MINVTDKGKCTGCAACVDVCSRKAISFVTDNEGFAYPEVDLARCNGCGLCSEICPELNISCIRKNDYERPVHVYAAINRRMDVRWDSTSGGLFSVFAEAMYEQGGYVGGAVYADDFTVENHISSDPSDLPRLRGSKYLQSRCEGMYRKIRELLLDGEKVLACGTPCQMAALRSFLRRDYDNLLIVDFICRGVNSPKVYRRYLDSLEERFGGKVVYVKAKNKELGWRSLARKVVFDNGQVYYGTGMQDPFRRGYHTNVYCRPSCYECQYKGFPRMSDITLADYWGIEKIDRNLDNNAGTSMVLLNSDKGIRWFEQIKDRIEYKETELQQAIRGNQALVKAIDTPDVDRASFFEELERHSFDDVAEKYFPEKPKKGKSLVRKLLRTLKLSPGAYLKFLKVNCRKNTISDFRAGNVLYTMPGVVFDIHPSARIDVKAPVIYGNIPVRGMCMPTCLKMEEGTSLEFHGGPLTRYGDKPYNLRYGAYIEIINGGRLVIGQGAANVGLNIMCAKEIIIGNGVRIGRNVSIRDWHGPHVIVNDTYVNHAPVHIEDHVWLGSDCRIMPGVTIGEGAVVASGAVVTGDVPPRTMVAGVPARVIREDVQWY